MRPLSPSGNPAPRRARPRAPLAARLARRVLNARLFGSDGARAPWLVLGLGTLVVLVLWAAIASRLRDERTEQLATARRLTATTASAFEQRTLRRLEEAGVTSRLLKYLWERDGTVDVGDALARGLIPAGAYTLVGIVDAYGSLVASSDPRTLGLSVGDPDALRAHREARGNALAISPPVTLPVLPASAIQLSLRIDDARGGFAGFVLLAVDPADFVDFYPAAELGVHGTVGVVGTDGVYRARRVSHGPDSAAGQADAPLAAQAARAPVGTFEAASPVDGVVRVMSYRKLADYPLIVQAGVARDEALAGYRLRRDLYLQAGFAVSALLVACLVLLTALAFMLKRSRRRAWAIAEELKLVSHVFASTADAVVISDPDDRILRVNSAFTTLTGFTPDEVVGKRLAESPFAPLDPAASEARLEEQRAKGFVTGEVERQRKDGTPLWLWVTATFAYDDAGKVTHLIRVFTDISALKETQRHLESLAATDALTGLENRRTFHQRLPQALERVRRRRARCALLYIDLDGFKAVNDREGHETGDHVLVEVARRMREALRTGDAAFRLGGDEFAVLLEDVESGHDAVSVAARIVAAIGAIGVRGIAPVVGASVGIAVFPDDSVDMAALIAQADAAMYEAKALGPNHIRRHDIGRSPPAADRAPAAVNA